MTDFQSRLDALPEWPKWDALPMAHTWVTGDEQINPIAHAVCAYAAALARLALLWTWVETQVPHLEGCPWRGLTRDTQGLLPDCRCRRDVILAATEGPK